MSATIYRKEFVEEARRPEHFGKIRGADLVLDAANPTCGDEITVYVKLDDSRSMIHDARFDGRGCMVMMAAASRLLDHIEGMPLAKALRLTEEDALKVFGSPVMPSRKDCALMAWRALKRTSERESERARRARGAGGASATRKG